MIRKMKPALRIDVLSLFPKTLEGFVSESILAKAIDSGLIEVNSFDLRRQAKGKHRETDDRPFGGGAGMVMKPEPFFAAVNEIANDDTTIIYMAPDGEKLSQQLCNKLSCFNNIIILCGHYKGIDQRIRDHLVTREISIGDFVLTGGELPAAILTDSIVRLLPGVLGNEMSALTDSFQDNLIAPPVYSKPSKYKDWEVPEILLSGNQKKIEDWRNKKAIELTNKKRPKLL